MLDFFARGLRTRAQDLSESVKLTWLLGEYLEEQHSSGYYARGQSLVPLLRTAYDDALVDADVLAMPTVPMEAMPIPTSTMSWDEYLVQARSTDVNTAPFNVTGHPAITVPCAKSDGLPVGIMFVGRRFQDVHVLQAAQAFEEQVGGFDTFFGHSSTASRSSTTSSTSRRKMNCCPSAAKKK